MQKGLLDIRFFEVSLNNSLSPEAPQNRKQNIEHCNNKRERNSNVFDTILNNRISPKGVVFIESEICVLHENEGGKLSNTASKGNHADTSRLPLKGILSHNSVKGLPKNAPGQGESPEKFV